MNEPIQEKAPKPPGLLPKNVQSWLLIGLALFMVIIMWATGGKKPPATAKTNAAVAPVPAPLEVNETKINELQDRIQELQRQQLVAQNALAQQSHLLGSGTPDQQQEQRMTGANQPPAERVEDPIQTERKKRNYLSLFESNVALTYRKTANGAAPVESDTALPRPNLTADAAQYDQLLKALAQNSMPQPPSPAQLSTPARAPHQEVSAEKNNTERKEEPGVPAAAIGGARNAAAGKTYVIFEGTILESVLINRLEGQFAGPVECLLTTDVYSHDRQHVLIPAGTKLLGETRRVDNFGQTRLAVTFHRLLMPDGYSAGLDQFKGLDQIGDSGLRDQVNNHYLRIFGTSLAIGALGAIAQAGTGGALTANGSDLMRQGFAQSTAQSSAQILDKFLNVMPTVTIREGHRVKVYLAGDLALPDYNNHKMPSDF
jgi:type IV secretory pathway VirB10-like protein